MATNFPSSLDTLTNPTSSDSLASPSHAAQHANVNDAVEALQAKVGVDGSAVATSLDYKVANFTNKLGSGSGNTYPWSNGEELHAADLNAALGSGRVLQTVGATYATEETVAGGPFSLTNTSLAASITPTSTANKILVIVNVSVRAEQSGAGTGFGQWAIKRASTVVFENEYFGAQIVGTASRHISDQMTLIYLDSPSTTSSTTYTLAHAAEYSTARTFYNNTLGQIVLMEIAA